MGIVDPLKERDVHHRKASLLNPAAQQIAVLRAGPPILIVAVDTEAEFDWRGPFLRTHTKVDNLRNQIMAQKIFDRFGVRPIYLVDYAVATQCDGYMPLQDIVKSGRCEIGAHLHPWITPPLTEELSDRASFSHNLTTSLQSEKLARLTEAIKLNLGVDPIVYRAGRYGVGENIAEILEQLGYAIDMSVQPGLDMSRIHGPDFREAGDRPYWFGTCDKLLEIPATTAFLGLLAHRALPKAVSVRMYDLLLRPALTRLRGLGIFARLRLLDRIPMSPEGVTLHELRRLTENLLSRGNRVFVFSYHSSSLLPGNTEYVRSPADLHRFLNTISGYLEYFVDHVGGISMTPSELRIALLKEATTFQADLGSPGRDQPGKGPLPYGAREKAPHMQTWITKELSSGPALSG